MRDDHRKLSGIFKEKAGQEFTHADILAETIRRFPNTNPSSILPSDHATRHKGCCRCVFDDKTRLFDKVERGWYKVRKYVDLDDTNSMPRRSGCRGSASQRTELRTGIADLWGCEDETKWKAAWQKYWSRVKPRNLALEKELNYLNVKIPSDIDDWYSFLRYKYIPCKYTRPGFCKRIQVYFDREYGLAEQGIEKLRGIIDNLFTFDLKDIKEGLRRASRIKGLGVAGASGLLSLLFPEHFGTVDQFVAKALRCVRTLPEADILQRMNPECLTVSDGVILVRIMRQKAQELNCLFSSAFWTPRKVDMILWATRD